MKPPVEKPALPRLSYTRAETALICGVSQDVIKKAHNSGALKAKRSGRTGGNYLYLHADIQAWLESLTNG